MTDHLHRELDAVASREPIGEYPSAAIRSAVSTRAKRRRTAAAVVGGSLATLAVVTATALATTFSMSSPGDSPATTSGATSGATTAVTDGVPEAGDRRTVAVGRLAIDVPAEVDVLQSGKCGPRNDEVLLRLSPNACGRVGDPGAPYFGAHFERGVESDELVVEVSCNQDDDMCTGNYQADGISLRVDVRQPQGGARAYLEAEVTDHVRVLDEGQIGIPTSLFLDAYSPEEYVEALDDMGLRAELGTSPARTDDAGFVITDPPAGTVVREGSVVRVG